MKEFHEEAPTLRLHADRTWRLFLHRNPLQPHRRPRPARPFPNHHQQNRYRQRPAGNDRHLSGQRAGTPLRLSLPTLPAPVSRASDLPVLKNVCENNRAVAILLPKVHVIYTAMM